MIETKYEEFLGSTLKIVNYGADRESWDIYEYKIYDGDYLLWEGYLYDSDLNLNSLADHYKNIIELNLKFKNIARITNDAGNIIHIFNKNAEDFVDWLISLDMFGFTQKIRFDKILIIEGEKREDPNYVEPFDSYRNSIYKATIIQKNSYQNVVNTSLKNVINILRQAYGKNKIEIFAYYKDGENSSNFKIEIDRDGDIKMGIKYTKSALVPGALSEETKEKIKKYKQRA